MRKLRLREVIRDLPEVTQLGVGKPDSLLPDPVLLTTSPRFLPNRRGDSEPGGHSTYLIGEKFQEVRA